MDVMLAVHVIRLLHEVGPFALEHLLVVNDPEAVEKQEQGRPLEAIKCIRAQ